MPLQNWEEVQAAAEQIMLGGGVVFDANTIANAREIMRLCRAHCSLPRALAKGYWTTLSISWPGFELEVFEDRIEVYHFRPDGNTAIWEEPFVAGKEFSPRFINELRATMNHMGE